MGDGIETVRIADDKITAQKLYEKSIEQRKINLAKTDLDIKCFKNRITELGNEVELRKEMEKLKVKRDEALKKDDEVNEDEIIRISEIEKSIDGITTISQQLKMLEEERGHAASFLDFAILDMYQIVNDFKAMLV